MKVRFINTQGLEEGLRYVLPDLAIENVVDAEITVIAQKTEENVLRVSREEDMVTILYKEKASFFRGLATAAGWLRADKDHCQREEVPLFSTNGAMGDMSRNAVMNIKTLKFMFRKMALMGQNMFMLYTEDTYEIPGRPYFGHLRGRYTMDEIRELDAYALALGIELIPCIQMLGHLSTALRWAETIPYRDTHFSLCVGEPETYSLIEDMLKTISQCFTTKRIHIGMDETHDLGTGRFLDKNGYVPRTEIYFEHLKQLKILLDRYGFKPMMWSDMFFKLAGSHLPQFEDYDVRVELPENFGEKTQGIQQVFWDYYHDSEDFYRINMEKHIKLGVNTVFAGGVWAWSSFAIPYSYSLKMSVPALNAAKKCGVREVIATVWHNGSECNTILSLAGLAWYADFGYRGRYDADGVKECFENATGLPYQDFMDLEALETPLDTAVLVSRMLAYNDPLIGVVDAYLKKIQAKEYYAPLTAKFQELSKEKGEFTPAFSVIEKLSSLFELKADFGIRLRKAYLAQNKSELSNMAVECDEIIKRIQAYRNAHRKAWFRYNSPFGWEVHDIRIGGMISRFDTAKMRIQALLNGEIDRIEELEAERLFLNEMGSEDIGKNFLWHSYSEIATVNIL